MDSGRDDLRNLANGIGLFTVRLLLTLFGVVEQQRREVFDDVRLGRIAGSARSA
jgi:hypothetical protein